LCCNIPEIAAHGRANVRKNQFVRICTLWDVARCARAEIDSLLESEVTTFDLKSSEEFFARVTTHFFLFNVVIFLVIILFNVVIFLRGGFLCVSG